MQILIMLIFFCSYIVSSRFKGSVYDDFYM